MLISQQVTEFAGWDTAWLTERRGRDGKWVKGLGHGFLQETFPGMPHIQHGPDPEHREQELLAKLAADQESGIKSESQPHAKRGLVQAGGNANYFGNSADTQVVTFNNGHKWVRKRGQGMQTEANEIVASRISDVVGAGAPGVVAQRSGPDTDPELWEEYARGAKPAIEWMGGTDEDEDPLGDNDPYNEYISPQGERIGLLDNLTGNGDRHFGNWMVHHTAKDGDVPVPIDHGNLSWQVDNYKSGSGPFGEDLWNEPESLVQFPAEQWTEWQAGLNNLKPYFEKYGMDYEYQNMMMNFDQMHQYAIGTES